MDHASRVRAHQILYRYHLWAEEGEEMSNHIPCRRVQSLPSMMNLAIGRLTIWLMLEDAAVPQNVT